MGLKKSIMTYYNSDLEYLQRNVWKTNKLNILTL